jgi:catechol 2,3-dioxygenase
MIKARKLGHLVMNVSNLEASRDFYCTALGMQVMAEHAPGKIVFLSLGEQHHDLALVQRATGAPPDPTQPGLVHMAWQVEDFPTLQAAYRELLAAGIEPEPIQHNVTNSLYMKDPDGNLVELYCDRWGDRGREVMRTQGPQRKTLDMETGEAVGEAQELLKAKV